MTTRASRRPDPWQPQLIRLRATQLTCELTLHIEGASDHCEAWLTIHEVGRPESILACWSDTVSSLRDPDQLTELVCDLVKRTRSLLDPF